MKYLKYVLFLCILSFGLSSKAQVEAELLGRWSVDTLVGSAAFNNVYNEIWGYAKDGIEYAIIGSTEGTHFINVTDPKNPTEVVFVEGAVKGPQIIHRDYHDHQGYLYAVADEGSNSTLQIIDMAGLPNSVNVVYDSKEYIRRSHNIFIDPSSNLLYSLISGGDDIGYTPMRIFDISNPEQPVPIQNFNSIGGFEFSQVHDAFVQNDTAYLNCGPGGFCMADFSDPANPILIASMGPEDYMQSGYNHSGWLSKTGEVYYMADETHGTDLKVVEMEDLPDIEVVEFFNAGSEHPEEIPHNLIVKGDSLYVSYYYDGMQVFDITNPRAPERVLYYDTYLEDNVGSYHGAWGVYPFLPSGNILISDMQSGLFVLAPNAMISNTEDLNEDQFIISPNPSSGNIQIRLNGNLDLTGEIILNDIKGKTVYQGYSKYLNSLGTADLNLDVPSGVYFLSLKTKTGKYLTEKCIIK